MEVLTNLEKKLLEILTKIMIYGVPQVVELGFQKQSTKKPSCSYKTSRTRNAAKRPRKHLSMKWLRYIL